MITGVYSHIAAAGAALAVGAGGAWWTQGQRYGFQLEQLRHQQTTAQLADTRQAVQSMAEFQKRITDALANFQTTNQRNSAAQQDLERSLRDLRSTTAGMRSNVAGLPERLEGVNQPALVQYASTCTALLTDLAERGGRMAERGADIARKADSHSADALLATGVWHVGEN